MNAPENISNKPLRVAMPTVAAFIDDMRAAFGAEGINASIKGGMAGVPTFYARENGHEVGTPLDMSGRTVVSGEEMVVNQLSQEDIERANRKHLR